MRDFWVLGANEFADQAGKYLMTNLRNRNEDMLIHMHDFYEVSYQGRSIYDSNPLSKFRNALVAACMAKWKKPHSILIVFGGKSMLKDNYVIQDGPWRIINWIIDEMKRVLFHRRQQMPAKALPNFSTRLFVTGLLPVNNHREQLKRDKFNITLQDIAAEKGLKLILCNSITPGDKTCFDVQGNVTLTGFNKFWKEVSEAVNIIDTKGYKSYQQMLKLSLQQKHDKAQDVSRNHSESMVFGFADQNLQITSRFGGNPDETFRSVSQTESNLHLRGNDQNGNNFHRIDDTITNILEGEQWYKPTEDRSITVRGPVNNDITNNRRG